MIGTLNHYFKLKDGVMISITCDQAFFFSGSAKVWQRESRRSTLGARRYFFARDCALPRKKERLIAGYDLNYF